MSTSSDSEEFYDAEDVTPNRGAKKAKERSDSSAPNVEEGESVPPITENDKEVDKTSEERPVPVIVSSGVTEQAAASIPTVSDSVPEVEQKVQENERRRQRIRELRRRIQAEDEDGGVGNAVSNPSPPDSQTSSAEGIYPSSRTTHPFRIIEHDAISLQSVTSLGRVGRILAGSEGGAAAVAAAAAASAAASVAASSAVSVVPSVMGSTAVIASVTVAPSAGRSTREEPDGSTGQVGARKRVPEEAWHDVMKQAAVLEGDGSGMLATPQEPDVIASTKGGGRLPVMAPPESPTMTAPVAPPRRKKKAIRAPVDCVVNHLDVLWETEKRSAPVSVDPVVPMSPPQTPMAPPPPITCPPPLALSGVHSPLPSPASTIESLTRELEHSLDIRSAVGGRFVVKPQDEDHSKAEGPSEETAHQQTGQISLSGSGGRLSTSGAAEAHVASSGSASPGGSSSPPSILSGGVSPSSVGTRSPRGSGERIRHVLGPDGSVEGALLVSSRDGPSSLPSSIGPQLNMFVRTRTDSGKQLTDLEILEQVTVLNLDTGERVPLSVAEDKLPQCINPLSLHIMRLTSEYVSNSSLERERDSDEESVATGSIETSSLRPPSPSASSIAPSSVGSIDASIMSHDGLSAAIDARSERSVDDEQGESSGRKRGKVLARSHQQLKRLLGSTVRRTVDKARSIAQSRTGAHESGLTRSLPRPSSGHDGMQREGSCRRHDDPADRLGVGQQPVIDQPKAKASSSHKGPYEWDGVQRIQELWSQSANGGSAPPGGGSSGSAIWCMKFSWCGRLLASAGQDRVLRIWVLRSAWPYFQDMRTKYNAEKVSPTPSQESLVSQQSSSEEQQSSPPTDAGSGPFVSRPFCTYAGHTSDLLDVSWSKNYFILSSSMDKTVRLWHISRKECLCCFQHIDFVTAIVFHPRDDRYFLSGSLDGKLRLWNIPDKKVAVWNEVEGQTKLITAANFCQNGKFAVVGSYDGRCIFYTTEQLRYHTQIHVRSTRGKNSKGRKISGIEPMPGEDKILVTSNDSRIRLYDLRDLNLSCKYKGYVNVSSQIKASFSHDGKYIVSGSENQCIYVWKTHHEYAKFSSVRRDRNDFWEGIKAHNAVVTCAVFAPNPESIIRQIDEERVSAPVEDAVAGERQPGAVAGGGGYVLVSADFGGAIKVFLNRTKPKHSSLPASALA
ncbi:WD repeat-containing protein 44 isoform X2 [Ischnura elegans]|uniref:WD repeat-containing protein 44 isoform X2 n=1 Tax=Ischnura elegans TaxID=197161 RepID=UPI001ED869F8|nr:WD repeat-containing protein 44 isoform X2 [Ischnura elegans]